MKKNELLTTAEIAESTGYSKTHVKWMIRKKIIKATLRGHTYLALASDIKDIKNPRLKRVKK